MYHVPGKYSGGSKDQYAWTQTKTSIEVEVPLAEAVSIDQVTVSIQPRRLRINFLRQDISGDLNDVIVVDDSTWELENSKICITLRKATPNIWEKLFQEDEAVQQQLLDGIDTPLSRAEALKQAKAKIDPDMKTNNTNMHVVQKENENLVLTMDDLPELPVVCLKRCVDCQITLRTDAQVVKLLVESCRNCTVTVNGRVTTETCEIWDSDSVTVHANSKLATLQLDTSKKLHIKFSKKDHFFQIIHAGIHGLQVEFADSPGDAAADIGFEEQLKAHPEINDTTDQFITRFINDDLTTEKVLRLANDYPTTLREQVEHKEKTTMHLDAGERAVKDVLESEVADKLTPNEKAELQEHLEKQRLEAQAAAEAVAEGELSNEKRAEYKKTAGNEAFKEGNVQQAAVYYTEALQYAPENPALYSNRAACLLKMASFDQALEDASKCIELDPTFAKGHFRKGLALQALERFEEAMPAFAKTLDIEPKNKSAASALQMCQMQAQRARQQR